MDKTYELSADGTAITCLLCGLTSHHRGDVEHRYCGKCHIFHDDVAGESPAHEFDCPECGRHIVQICGPRMTLCAACQSVPGWFHDPAIARILDPDQRRKPGAVH
jgi:hypothetical protein